MRSVPRQWEPLRISLFLPPALRGVLPASCCQLQILGLPDFCRKPHHTPAPAREQHRLAGQLRRCWAPRRSWLTRPFGPRGSQ